jgi:hypothetical protein
MARVEKLRRRLNSFEREDKPAFARWVAREFGPLLTRAREIEAEIRDKQQLVEEVDAEMRRSFCDPRIAYARILHRRGNPGAAKAFADAQRAAREDEERAAKLSDVEKEIIFQEWLREYFGINIDNLDDAAYDATFGTFKFHMFGADTGNGTARVTERLASARDLPNPKLKEMYRLLVRRLHPDIRADGDAAASALWHEVQNAYAARDLDRLETLLALSDIESNTHGEHTSLFQLRAAWTELRSAVGALRRSLRVALGDDAWAFARRGADHELRARVERSFDAELAKQARTLDYLATTIGGWSSQPISPEPVAAETPQFVA